MDCIAATPDCESMGVNPVSYAPLYLNTSPVGDIAAIGMNSQFRMARSLRQKYVVLTIS